MYHIVTILYFDLQNFKNVVDFNFGLLSLFLLYVFLTQFMNFWLNFKNFVINNS